MKWALNTTTALLQSDICQKCLSFSHYFSSLEEALTGLIPLPTPAAFPYSYVESAAIMGKINAGNVTTTICISVYPLLCIPFQFLALGFLVETVCSAKYGAQGVSECPHSKNNSYQLTEYFLCLYPT